jgi:hypothetical protein
MYVIRCPNCKIRLILPDDDIASCQCSHCHEVFERGRRHEDASAAEADDPNLDISVAAKETEILVERKRYLAQIQGHDADSIESLRRWNRSKLGCKVGFVFGLTASILAASVGFGDADSHTGDIWSVAFATLVMAALGFMTMCLANSPTIKDGVWLERMLVVIATVWIGAFVIFNWRILSRFSVAVIIYSVLTDFIVVLVSWLAAVGLAAFMRWLRR